MSDDELLDLVDLNDRVIGTIMRSQTSKPFKGYIRAAELFIVNDHGKLWVPRRSLNKKIAPGGLDYSAAGHVASGETYESTLYREVAEEINMNIDKDRLKLLHKFAPSLGLPPYFRAVYLYYSNETPNYNKDDFSDYAWLTPQALLTKLKAGEPAKQSLLETLEYICKNEVIKER